MSYARVSIQGTIQGGDNWSVNPVFDPTGEFPGWNQSQADAAAAALVAVAIPANLTKLFSTAVAFTGVRLEVRDDATDDLIGLAEANRSTPLTGTTGPSASPQQACVASLRTTTPGASGRGRIYWPAPGASLGSDMRLLAPTNAQVAADFKTYFSALAGALASSFAGISFDLAVRSRTTHTTPHVSRIQVGDIMDTQRRRRDKLPEGYATVAYP